MYHLNCRLQTAVDEALQGVSGAKPTVHIVQTDMTSFESIRASAAKINAQNLPIDVRTPTHSVSNDIN